MSVLSSIGRLANRYAKTHGRHCSQRILLSLPVGPRKDIGLPEVFESRESRRSVTFPADVV